MSDITPYWTPSSGGGPPDIEVIEVVCNRCGGAGEATEVAPSYAHEHCPAPVINTKQLAQDNADALYQKAGDLLNFFLKSYIFSVLFLAGLLHLMSVLR